MELETKRLKLRQWQDQDKEPFYALNSDPEVMKYFPSIYDKQQSDAMLDKARSLIEDNGWGFWACEVKETQEFIGFVGLNKPGYKLPFSPCVEVGWRLARKHWKKGFATEAATACLKFGFENLKLEKIVSFAVKSNAPSIAVMERIGMVNSHANFDHPKVEKDDLKEHVLYKINKHAYRSLLD